MSSAEWRDESQSEGRRKSEVLSPNPGYGQPWYPELNSEYAKIESKGMAGISPKPENLQSSGEHKSPLELAVSGPLLRACAPSLFKSSG